MNWITKYFGLLWIGSVLLAASLFGQAGNDNPGGPTAEYHGSITTAGYYDPYTGNAKREITDIVVQGSIGAYPLKYTRTYDTRGVAWTNNYQWGMWVRPPDEDRGNGDGLYDGPVMGIQYPNGGHFDTLVYDSPWDIDANGPQGASDKLITCSRGGCTPLSTAFYELWRADGGKVLFEAVPQKPRSYRAYAIIDPYGQTSTLTYNANDRLWKVTEPGGRYLEFLFSPFTYWYPCWGPNNTPPHWVTVDMLTGIRADDGRGNTMETVTYGYDWIRQGRDCPAPAAYFAHVYYDDGAQATYTYAETNSDDSAAVYGAITPRVCIAATIRGMRAR